MGRLFNALTYVVAFVAVVYGVGSGLLGDSEPDPRRPPVERVVPAPQYPSVPPLRGGSRQVVTIDVGEKENSIGTGFSVGPGWWLTARHVVDGCDVVGIVTGPRRGVRAHRVHLHPDADLALLEIPTERKIFPFATTSLQRNQAGYSVGYPQGQPGAVYATLMGQLRMRSVGRYRIEEPVVAWAEKRRIPNDLPALGGLSGGPMFDVTGAVVGVLVAASDRRGRVMTTAPSSMAALIAAHNVDVQRGGGDVAFSGRDLPAIGKRLRGSLRVAKVVCQLTGPRRRPQG